MRIGHGYDAHRLKAGRPCVLCGVTVPSDAGPDGHSDADVPVHALMDALLGALALGDIGAFFPDSDMRYKDADSLGLLRLVCNVVRQRGYALANADMTIVAQQPRLSPYIARMREKRPRRSASASTVSASRPRRRKRWLHGRRAGDRSPRRRFAGRSIKPDYAVHGAKKDLPAKPGDHFSTQKGKTEKRRPA
jgi:2-C-methyl-D-erythritol 2,4-cyclodiphosphate synthase